MVATASPLPRVCLLTGEYPPDEGGVADYTRCLAEALAALGAPVDVLTTPSPVLRAARSGPHVRPVDEPSDGLDADAGPQAGTGGQIGAEAQADIVVHTMPAWDWGSLSRLRRTLRPLQPDIVHLQYQTAAFGMHPAANLAPWWAGRVTGATTAVTYHDLRVPYLFPKAGRLREVVTHLPARTADLAITTNADDHTALAAWGKATRLALIPIGSNVPDAPPPDYERDAFRAEHGITPSTRLLAYFGFLNASKGGMDLLAALAALRADGSGGEAANERDVRLVMIGGKVGASDPTNAAYLARFEAAAAAAGVAEAITWTGHVPRPMVSAWLHAADAVVLPYADGGSYRRGSLLAALEHGRPTVTTHAPGGPARSVGGGGGLPTLVDGESARLAPPEDGAALARAIASVLDDPTTSARLAHGAREIATAFGWPAIARRHLALYAQARVAGGGGAP